ncbi:MAG: tubulin-like doman-containing protein [Pirellulaceae bacterium]|nr:tubulin-like doman-containing protein [Pirellulaceae bacterium]
MSVISARTNEPIPGYRVGQRIGAGGYGEVWTAQAPGDLNKAIKFVYGLLDEDRAARELKALNRIKGVRHPFLLSLERIEVVDGQLIIVTELADCSLKDRFDLCRKNNQPGIPREELLQHLRDTADALDFMSEQHSLQHLDVKPENLLLLGGRIKVADFGLVKDMQDHSVSMMGGLTPVYAPPEVFEGRPSRRSDQYSLAIVYQEMLTGMLPFPGRTAAQLAAQHLNAKPRVSPLPAHDQPAIARALSKKPSDRFASCRELVDTLVAAGKLPAGNAAVDPRMTAATPGAVSGSAATAAPRTHAQMLRELEQTSQVVDLAVTGRPGAEATPAAPRVTAGGTPPPSAASDSPGGGASELTTSLANLGPPPPLVDLPPSDVDPAAWIPRPTLFVGVGGSGTRILASLRRRLNDRPGPPLAAKFPMLSLDSDARDLASVGETLRAEEMLSLPLRRSQDYRNESREILQWLSRRWLYNIPRSQQTEGMRPLGRLALVDHAGEALGKLRGAVAELVREAGLPPRVVLVAAPGGGTGGGMLTDLVFAARQLLDEAQLPQAEVLAVLAHGTGRNPQQQELAQVNALATLTELAQFHRGPYPGDRACGLAERTATEPVLSAAYLACLGEELSPEQFQAAYERVAEFLLLDSVTSAGAALEAARGEPVEGDERLRLRTFGLVQIGFAHDGLVDQATHRACRGVLERWLGEPKRADVHRSVRLFAEATTPPLSTGPQPADIDARVAELQRQFGLEAEPLVKLIERLAVDEMGGDPPEFFRSLIQMPAREVEQSVLGRWFAALGELFGVCRDETTMQAPPSKLKQVLEEEFGAVVAQIGNDLRPALEALVERPALRVHGAQRVAKGLQARLKQVAETLREVRCRLTREAQAAEQQLWQSAYDPRAKNKGPRRSPTEMQAMFVRCCQLRLAEFCAQTAGSLAHAAQSHIVATHDQLVDLARDLHHLAVRMAAHEIDDEESAPGDHQAALRRSVDAELRRSEDRLAQELDQQLSATTLAKAGGLKAAILAGGANREALVAELRQAARQAVLKQVGQIDVAGAMLSPPGGQHPLRECLAGALPWLQNCGGRRRLLCVVPEGVAENLTSGALAAEFGPNAFRQLPAVLPDATGDVVLLFEVGDLSLHHAAATLIGERADLADLATRLFTRSDVSWTPLLC